MSNEKNYTKDSARPYNVADTLRYLVAHPRAKDTINGIEKWWLSKSMNVQEKHDLEKSLDLLVGKGWLNGRYSAEAGKIYSLNENRLTEIKEFLEM